MGVIVQGELSWELLLGGNYLGVSCPGGIVLFPLNLGAFSNPHLFKQDEWQAFNIEDFILFI